MKWKDEVIIDAGIELVWDVIWNRAVLNDGVVDTVLAAGYMAQRVFGEHYVYEDMRIAYFAVLSCVANHELFKVVQCSYTFCNIYVVNEYFQMFYEGGFTKLTCFGSCHVSKGLVLELPEVGESFCAGKKSGLFIQRVKKFCE